MKKYGFNTTRRDFIKVAAASVVAVTTANAFAATTDSVSGPGKGMRVALAGLFEEVNTFAVETMGLATITGDIATGFQKYEGKEIIEEYRGSAMPFGGYIDALEEASVEIVPTVYYSYSAGPTIEGKAYQKMKQDILAGLKATMPLDAVALGLHGAAIAEGIDDVEGDLKVAGRSFIY